MLTILTCRSSSIRPLAWADVKGVWCADMQEQFGLGSGLNLTSLRLDRDRRAVVHASDLESQAAALWVRAIDARQELAARLLQLMRHPTPGADVRRVAEFLGSRPAVADALAAEFFVQHGHEAVPMSQSELDGCGSTLGELEARLRRRLVVVNQCVFDALAHAKGVSKLADLEAALSTADGARAVVATPVAWSALTEEARAMARHVVEIMRDAGDTSCSVDLLDVVDYGERCFGDDGEEDEPAVRPCAVVDVADAEGDAVASRPPARLAVPLALFSLEAVHARFGGRCLVPDAHPSACCACREAALLEHLCRLRQPSWDRSMTAAEAPASPHQPAAVGKSMAAVDLLEWPAPAMHQALRAPKHKATPRPTSASLATRVLQVLARARAHGTEPLGGSADGVRADTLLAAEQARRELLLGRDHRGCFSCVAQ